MNEQKRKALECLSELFKSEKAWLVLEELASRDFFTKRDASELYFRRFGKSRSPTCFSDAFSIFSRREFLEESAGEDLRAFKFVPNKRFKLFREKVLSFVEEVVVLLDNNEVEE